MNVLSLYLIVSIFFFGVKKKNFWKLLYLNQNWYWSRFTERFENLVCDGIDNNDNHNQPQFEH